MRKFGLFAAVLAIAAAVMVTYRPVASADPQPGLDGPGIHLYPPITPGARIDLYPPITPGARGNLYPPITPGARVDLYPPITPGARPGARVDLPGVHVGLGDSPAGQSGPAAGPAQ